jgi:DNA invertase Pin-like site-specific DNA recombinase
LKGLLKTSALKSPLKSAVKSSPKSPLKSPDLSLLVADKRRILEEAAQGGTGVAEVARRYGIDRRVLRRWKQELAAVPAPTFVTVQIADAGSPTYAGSAAAGALS